MPFALSQTDKQTIHGCLLAFFPKLTLHNYEVTSPCTDAYNCIAMAADDITKRWWPTDPRSFTGRDYYWPEGIPREPSKLSFALAFVRLGYEACDSDAYEPGFEKVALYVNDSEIPTHMAKQLNLGIWCSKLGNEWDIHHETLQVLHSETYGHVAQIMKRKIPLGCKR